MGLFDKPPTECVEGRNLVAALRNISTSILDDAQSWAWAEHEAGRLSDSQFFIVVRRLRVLASEPTASQGTK